MHVHTVLCITHACTYSTCITHACTYSTCTYTYMSGTVPCPSAAALSSWAYLHSRSEVSHTQYGSLEPTQTLGRGRSMENVIRHQWDLSLCPVYSGALFSGHQWDLSLCPVYSGALFSGHQWDLSLCPVQRGVLTSGLLIYRN